MNANDNTPLHLALACLATVAVPLAHSASTFVLVDNGGTYSFANFNSNNPGSVISSVTVSGLAPGEVLTGLDWRPATDTFYAIGANTDVYTIDPVTGMATDIGGYSNVVPGTLFGFDFNPAFTGGRFARIISNDDDNRVIDGVDGTYLGADKTDVFYPVGDPNAGTDPTIAHIAYTNSVAGASATQQYGIDTDLDALVTVANNAGTLGTVGLLGIDAGELGGFDIEGLGNEAILGFQNGNGGSEVYSVDLLTGQARLLGNFDGNIIGLTNRIPEPSRALLLGLVGLGFLAQRRR